MDQTAMFDTFKKYSRWMQHFTSPPVKWSAKKKRFEYRAGGFKYYLWCFHTFVGLGICTAGGVVVIFLSQMFTFYKQLPLAFLFLFVGQFSTAFAGFAINVGLILYGADFVKGWNTLVRMEGNLQNQGFDHRDSFTPHRNYLWITMTLFIWALTTYPSIFSLSAIFFRLDPYYHILSMLKITYLPAHIFRFYLICTAPAELCRFLAFTITVSISTFQMLRSSLVLLIQQHASPFSVMVSRMSGNPVESRYRHVQIVLISMESLIGFICLISQGLGLANGILSNFVSLKFYGTLPVWLYVIFPCIAIMILILANVMFNYLHNVPDYSDKLLRNLDYYTISQPKEGVKKTRKELRSLKVLTLSPILAGHKFLIYKRSTKMTYFVVMVKGADPHDEESFRRNVNDVFERLTTQLSNIPTKDDLTAEIGAMEARFTKKLEDLKISVKNMEASINEKLEGLQIGVRNLEVFEELRMDVDHREKLKKGRTRRSTDTLDAVASDYRLGILASQVRKSAYNETCKFVELLLNVQSDQIVALEEIRNAGANVSQGVANIITEVDSLKYYINNSFPDFYKIKSCSDDSSLSDSTFRNQQVICDKEWVIIQRRGTPTPPGKERTNFERIWEVYENGFGSLSGDFWLGLKTINSLTEEGFTQLRVDLEDWNRTKAYAMYDVFKVANSTEKYNLTVAGYTGTAGDALDYHNGQQFTTIDNDNDKSVNKSCAAIYKGGWWYQTCHKAALNSIYNNSSAVEKPGADLNSIYHNSSTVEKSGLGLVWNHWKGSNYSLMKVEMKIRKPVRLF
ncbi:Techylectin-5B [Folsomia candida]|uniref:Techylectin-5B n=1 Tax=Folsomia candida TaxID=158441 RepID=A0A226DNM0_FOLCA|nr:Techylectin-5B [Folsomia candida]